MGTERKTYSVVFAGAVLDLMRTTGTSENQLSIATEIPRATLNRRLRGARWSTPEMEAVAKHFGLSVSALCARGEALDQDGAA